MSHELRTPLNAVLGYLDLLDAGVAGPLTAEQGRYLGRVTASGKHLLGLIEEVLTFPGWKPAARRRRPRRWPPPRWRARPPSWWSPWPAPAAWASAWRRRASQGMELRTDPGKLRQVLVNLLGNAVKFTDAGEVVLTGPRREPGAVRFAVTDTGIGIAPEAREQISSPSGRPSRAPPAGPAAPVLAGCRRRAQSLPGCSAAS